jgi:transcriptional regulator with XRE-family HTH domain
MTSLHAERVASAVRAELARARVSQSVVAATLDLSQQAVSRRLTGRVAFDVEELGIVADLLGVEPRDLFPSSSTTEVQAAS